MERDFIFTYVLPILGFAIVMVVYYYLSKRKRVRVSAARQSEKGSEIKDDILARIYDNTNRLVYNATLSAAQLDEIKTAHHTLGRKWLRDGKWVFAFNKTGDKTYRPVPIPFDMDNPPSKVHRALSQHTVGIVFDVQLDKGFFQKYTPVLIWSGVILFIMWMYVAG